MDFVRNALGETGSHLSSFLHVHNFMLDELLNHGAVGLFLMLGMLVSFFIYSWKVITSSSYRRGLVYFGLVLLAYGMFHNPMLHEGSLAISFMVIAVVNAQIARIKMSAHVN